MKSLQPISIEAILLLLLAVAILLIICWILKIQFSFPDFRVSNSWYGYEEKGINYDAEIKRAALLKEEFEKLNNLSNP